MPQITVTPSAGFCFGVSRAVGIVYDLLDRNVKTATLGEIIHNPSLISLLEKRGVKVIDDISELSEDETLVIRSHGVPKNVIADLNGRNIKYFDATCPFVKKIHKIVDEESENSVILIAGDPAHPEVQGIVSYCKGEFYTFRSSSELQDFVDSDKFSPEKKYIMVSQTTFNSEEWRKCKQILKKVYTSAKIFDTICNATEIRQKESAELAEKSDIMIIVGGTHSSNTIKLYDICKSRCPSIFIETADELHKFDFSGKTNIGITAGASTPAFIIKEVKKTMSEILSNSSEELSFAEMLEQNFKSTYTGEKVTGVVTGISPNEVSVEIGTKHTGYIPLHELTDDTSAKPEDLVKIGQTLTLKVLRVNDVEGTMVLSKKKIDSEADFDRVMNGVESGEIFEGTVTDVVKGGVIVNTKGVKVFIPASQATLSRGDNIEALLHQKVEFKILEVNEQRKRAVGSIKAVLIAQRKERIEKAWNALEVGATYTGVVKSLTSYGAFVDIGGIDGMVHISELSWKRIKHPSEVVKVGDSIEVYIKDINTETKKISLGFKKASDNPWEIMKRDYPVGTVLKVKIVSLTAFGAFAHIIDGIDGLIHISQIANEHIAKPADVLSIGQEVEVKITEVDFEKKRVSLSMKALLPVEEPVSEEQPVEEKPAEEAAVEEKPAEEPVAEEKVVEESTAEEKPSEEPAAEEKPAEEPAAE